ncbi:MAG: DUF1272 domain-containing protein [Candidatus Binataceae bacterium]
MAALFDGLSRIEQIALLGRLEIAGGRLYRSLAGAEKNVKAREALIKAAEDEERNGNLLGLMSTPKAVCEKCAKALAADTDGCSCSFQCTFCEDCANSLRFVCPNCGGALEARQRFQDLGS